jgi:hypothetical protein
MGSTCQPGAERAKVARLEASSCVGGSNSAGRHRRAVNRAERARWAGREAEAQWGEGERAVGEKKKNEWAAAGPKGRMGRKQWKKILFRIKIKFLNIPRLSKFAQGDLGEILT